MLDLEKFNENYDNIDIFGKTEKLANLPEGTEIVVIDADENEHILVVKENKFTWKDGD